VLSTPSGGVQQEKHVPGPGVFVEFGAYDGVLYSHTANLVKKGWRGVYAEPVPEYYELCKKEYSDADVVVENVAIGSEEGELTLHVGGVVSSGSREMIEYCESDPVFSEYLTGRYVTVPQTTLDLFLTKHNVPKGFEFLVVDVEGMEWDVFKNFDIKKWRPQVVVVELHKFLLLNMSRVLGYFVKNGYRKAFGDKVNTVFIRG
jgi:FkbM family methyltransferase